jgi:eukaryotic-like serine/threonine-protein kinase
VVHKNLAAREDIIARFRREARICGTIRNRHVGQVYDVGELPSGAPYMVMELQEGASLAKVLADERRLPISMIVDIGRQLLVGLQAAHALGVIHRDVKPDNIMIVTESNGQTVVKLVDFGIGKSVNADIKNRNVTQEGMVVGSPDYMPPEQLRGEDVDHRVDVYAAGVVLYELTTGSVPFDAGTLPELFIAILTKDVRPPSRLRHDCPPELEQVILRAMARDPQQRYQSAAEMEQALDQAQRAAGLSRDTLHRFSKPPELGAQPAPVNKPRRQSSEGYALETERLRTGELQVPIKRGGSRVLVMAGAAVVAAAGLGFALMRPSAEAPEHTVEPATSEASAKAAAAAPLPVAPAAAPVPAVPPAAEPPPVIPTGAEPPPEAAAAPAEPEPAREPAPEPSESSKRSRSGHRDKKRGSDPAPAAAAPAAPPPAPAAPAAPAGASAAELVQQASSAFIQGQMPRARALYRDATAKAPTNADAWRGLGMVSSRMGQREEAARAFNRYLSLRPNAPDAAAIKKKLDEL